MEYTPVEQKQHKKHENDQWRILILFQVGNIAQTCQLAFELTCLPSNMYPTKQPACRGQGLLYPQLPCTCKIAR